jgi:short-subunit dehydrogenase
MTADFNTHYGPWALIAGGSEGIGLEFARRIAAAGINLLLLARRPEPLAAARKQLLSEYPVEVRTDDRSQSIEMMSQGAAGMYHLPYPIDIYD